jgi:hypothetical protein
MIGQGQKGGLAAATTLMSFYDDELEIRYSNFLVRHNMLDTFNDEDQAGVRWLQFGSNGDRLSLLGRCLQTNTEDQQIQGEGYQAHFITP